MKTYIIDTHARCLHVEHAFVVVVVVIAHYIEPVIGLGTITPKKFLVPLLSLGLFFINVLFGLLRSSWLSS